MTTLSILPLSPGVVKLFFTTLRNTSKIASSPKENPSTFRMTVIWTLSPQGKSSYIPYDGDLDAIVARDALDVLLRLAAPPGGTVLQISEPKLHSNSCLLGFYEEGEVCKAQVLVIFIDDGANIAKKWKEGGGFYALMVCCHFLLLHLYFSHEDSSLQLTFPVGRVTRTRRAHDQRIGGTIVWLV